MPPPGAHSGATAPSARPAPAPEPEDAPGLRDSIGGVREGVSTLISAHVELAKAEIGDAAKQVALIAGLGAAAFALALFMGILLFVGSLLFLGEWLFGSIGWGVLDGVLLILVFIEAIGLNLAGGKVGAWARAALLSLVVAIILGVIFSTNGLHNTADWLATQLNLGIDRSLAVWLIPALVGGVILGLIAAALGARAAGGAAGAGGFVAAFLLGFLLIGFFAATPLNTQVAAAFAATTWLVLWLALAGLLAWRAGIDPKARYDRLMPRESMAQFQATKSYLEQQWQRQRKKLVGR